MDFDRLRVKLAENKPVLPWQEYLESDEFKAKLDAVAEKYKRLQAHSAAHPHITSRREGADSSLEGFHILTPEEVAAVQEIHPDWYDEESLSEGAKPCLFVSVGLGFNMIQAYTELTFMVFFNGKLDIGSCDPYESYYEWVGKPAGLASLVDAPYAQNATGDLHPDEQLGHIEAALDLVAATPRHVTPAPEV